MDDIVKNIIHKYYGENPVNITSLGGGYYARVFLAEIKNCPHQLVVKIYLTKDIHLNEKKQLKTLGTYSKIHVPEVYFAHTRDDEIPHDALIMEYIPGVSAGFQTDIPMDSYDHIGNKIVNNLIHIHSINNVAGFGDLDGNEFSNDWREMYRTIANEIVIKAKTLADEDRLDKVVYEVVDKAMNHFDEVFYLPIEKASLIHGDHNTWNILLNHELTDVVGLIDPYKCCWGDFEYDLYQLNNANGKMLNLLERYKEKCPLSENFYLKLAFYELYSEIMHYYDSNVDPDNKALRLIALRLRNQLNARGTVL